MRAVKRRPGGRTERVRQAVAIAVLDLISAGKLDFEMKDVATLSGVGRSTLFRRWPDRDTLIAEALHEHVSQLQVVTSRNWERDLATNIRALCRFVARPTELAINRILVTTDNAALKDVIIDAWLPMLRAFEQPLRHASSRGDLDSGTDISQVVGFIFSEMSLRSMVNPASMDTEYVDGLTRFVLRGIKRKRDVSAR